MLRKLNNKWVAVSAAVLTLASYAHAADPTTMDGVSDLGAGYISKGTTTAIAAAVLGFGWVGYRIVKKFTKGATST